MSTEHHPTQRQRPAPIGRQLSVPNNNPVDPTRSPRPVSGFQRSSSSTLEDRQRIETIEKKIDLIIGFLAKSGNTANSGEEAEKLLQQQQLQQEQEELNNDTSLIDGPFSPNAFDEDSSEDEDEMELLQSQESFNIDAKVMNALGAVKEDGPPPVLNESDDWMINPKNTFRMSWDLGVIMPLLVYLTLVMPFRLCFENEATQFSTMYWFEFLIDMLFIMDIFMNFRTGYVIYVDGGGGGATESDELIEYDKIRVAISYCKSWFLLDVISGVPFSLLELVLSSSGSTGSLKSAKALKLLRFLKLGRLLKMDKILSNLDRDTLDIIEDFFQNGSTRSAVVMMRLVFYMAYVCHLMACGFVLVGRLCNKEGLDCWFDHEDTNGHGPYHAKDTTGGELVFSIYIAAFYFCLTTMTSVGYGDIVPHNNTERIYIIMLEFIGAVIFATIIAAITSVVTSMDMNARKTAEQLDAVASFVAVRQFPENMAKRIRRHFRHFYSLKSAIDESKIFSELSSSLRKEVSAYLINELMGRESVFLTMSPTLWPRLLPLLRPMGFEKDEIVCAQGDECTEMYVVLVGTLVGVTKDRESEAFPIPDEERDPFGPRMRHIITGGSVNVLHVLGLWHECVETVTAEVAVESYAVSEIDFASLFPNENTNSPDPEIQKLRKRESSNFKMIPYEGAPYGKPLYFSCFSIVEVSVLKLRQPDAKHPGITDTVHLSDNKKSSGATVWVIIDLVHVETGMVLNDNWRHRTERKDATARQLVDNGGVYAGRPSIQVSDIDFVGEARWTDINEKFDNSVLRLRVMSAVGGKESVVASLQIRLSDLEKQSKYKRKGSFGASTTPKSPIPNSQMFNGSLPSPPSGSDVSDSSMDSKMDEEKDTTPIISKRVESAGYQEDTENPIRHFHSLENEQEKLYIHECLKENVLRANEEREKLEAMEAKKEKEKDQKMKMRKPKKYKNKHKLKHSLREADDPNRLIHPNNDLSNIAYLEPREGEIIGWFTLEEGKGGGGGGQNNTTSMISLGVSGEDPHKVRKSRSTLPGYALSGSMSDSDSLNDSHNAPELATKVLLKIRVKRPEYKRKKANTTLKRRTSSQMDPLTRNSSGSMLTSSVTDMSSPRYSKHKSSNGILNVPLSSRDKVTHGPVATTPLPTAVAIETEDPSPTRSRSANVIKQRKLAALAAKNNPKNRKVADKDGLGDGVSLAEL